MPDQEILSAEQPCVLCGQLLQIVTWSVDRVTNEERIERTDVAHSQDDCMTFARLYQETWPPKAVGK